MSTSIVAADFEAASNQFIANARRKMVAEQSRQSDLNESVFTDTSESGNTCTDGNDDGKIGFFSAIGNIIEGAAKSIVKGIKGAFTDSNGNFSLGKTLLSIGTAAACVVFPAAGVVLAGAGIVTGGVKLASGVVNALNADTDAEAKDAWEQVGEGGLTLGLSVFGAKSSIKAVQNSSSAGALSTFKETSSFTSNPLGYLKALGKDMISSSKNNFARLKSNVRTFLDARELNNTRKAAANQKGALTADELAQQRKLIMLEKYSSPEVKATADGLSQFGTNVRSALKPSNIKTSISSILKHKGGQGLIKTLKANASANGGLVKAVLSGLSAKQKAIYAALIKDGANYNTLVQQYGYENVIGVLQAFGEYRLLDGSI